MKMIRFCVRVCVCFIPGEIFKPYKNKIIKNLLSRVKNNFLKLKDHKCSVHI